MGRKARITKDMILEAAYSLLDEAGIGAVAIKSIAAKLDCSTQPISWQFGSMGDLKKELYYYAGKKLWCGIEEDMKEKNAVEAFFQTGVRYISVACDHPNVFRFLQIDNMADTIGIQPGEQSSILSQQMNAISVELLAKQYKVPKEKIGEAVQNTVIYTHGLASMMLWDNFRMPKEVACQMVYDMGIKLLKDIGIDVPEQ